MAVIRARVEASIRVIANCLHRKNTIVFIACPNARIPQYNESQYDDACYDESLKVPGYVVINGLLSTNAETAYDHNKESDFNPTS